MLEARQEGEALLRAEVVRLTEENSQLQEEIRKQRTAAEALEERLAEAGTASNVWPCFLFVFFNYIIFHVDYPIIFSF